MTGIIMKSTGQLDPNRMKIEGRQSVHRRKMSKNSPIVNGAEDKTGYSEDETMLRQVNLAAAAAYHDHISCTKSAELCKISDSKEGRVNLPCETDHIYANCSETKLKGHNMVANAPSHAKDNTEEKRQLQEMCLLQLDLIKQLEEQNAVKDRQIQALKQENELLKVRQERMERRMCLLKRNLTKSDNESDNISDVGSALSDNATPSSTVPTVNAKTNSTPIHLVTRYLGRRSKTVPLRALKRRYLGPPKSLPIKKTIKYSSSTASMSSASETQDEEKTVKSETVNSVKIPVISRASPVDNYRKHRKDHKKKEKKPKIIPRTEDCLTTDKEYYLPDYYSLSSSLDNTETIDVPSWRFRPVTSFYQMEGTENIDDRVFHRRHVKCEQDEKRRKRWDIQRLREQKINEKQKHKRNGNSTSGRQCHRKENSFFPDPNDIELIEITDTLPVLAFGHPIPLFQPSEFNLPWKIGDYHETPEKIKKTRITAGSKVT